MKTNKGVSYDPLRSVRYQIQKLADATFDTNHQESLFHFHDLAAMSEGEVSEEQFRVLEGVVYFVCVLFTSYVCAYFVDPKSPGSFSFLGGKERIRIPLKREHNSLDAFKRHIVEHAGLKTEAEKRGIGSSIDLKLCRLVKSVEGSKAFSINTQAQWNVERPLFVDSAVLQGECFYY